MLASVPTRCGPTQQHTTTLAEAVLRLRHRCCRRRLPEPSGSSRCTRSLSSQCLSRLHFPFACAVLARSQWSATPIRFLASRAPFQRAACSSGALLARYASRRATSATPEAAISRRCRHRSVRPTWCPRRRRCRARARAFRSFPTTATESCRSHRAPPVARLPCCSAHATCRSKHEYTKAVCVCTEQCQRGYNEFHKLAQGALS